MPHHDKHDDPRRSDRSDENREQDIVRDPDEQEAYERALQRESEDLPGDMEDNRNLSGSSTYETLSEEEEDETERGRGSSGEPGNR